MSMPKKILLPLILLLVIILIPSRQTAAHELKTENDTSVLIHINPDDRAITGQESEILFLISDRDKKFAFENCDCRATIIFGTTTLLTQPLLASKTSYRGIFGPAVPFVFPHSGQYTIQLSAMPKTQNDFEGFNFSYEISVRDTPPQMSGAFKIVYSLIVVAILAGSIAAFMVLINKNSRA